MSGSRNLQVAWEHWRCLNEGRIEDALAPLNDAGTWWSLRSRRATPMREFKQTIRRALGTVPIQFTLISSLEQGDRVLLELESHAELPDGAHYNNVYCFLLTLWDDTVLHVREYYDTKHLDLLLAALPSDIVPEGDH